MGWENIFSSHTSDIGLYPQYPQIFQIKVGTNNLMDISPEKIYEW
jgi:hypothetical protein